MLLYEAFKIIRLALSQYLKLAFKAALVVGFVLPVYIILFCFPAFCVEPWQT